MFNKNNKAQQSSFSILLVLLIIMIFGLISVISVIVTYTTYTVGNDYVVLNLYNASQTFNSTAEINAGFADVTRNYQDIDLSFIDRMWAFAYFVLVVISFRIAYMAKSTNYFSFISMLIYGMMFILFVAGLFGTLTEYLYSDILLKMFINLAVNTPLLGYYVLNYGWVFLLHGVGLLLTTVLDFDFAFRKNRKQKEIASLDNEII